MAKQITSVTVSGNNNTGRTIRKVSESQNGAGPAPVFLNTGLVMPDDEGNTVSLGFYQGTTITCTNKIAKTTLNKALNALKVARTGGGVDENGNWVSTWTRPDGVAITATVTDLGMEFERLS